MIYESAPWKDKLLGAAKRLRELMLPTRTPLRRCFAIEQVFFLSAFGMRKLWEAHKLSSSWGQRLVSCRTFALRAQTPTVLSWHKIDEYYDLGSQPTEPANLDQRPRLHRLARNHWAELSQSGNLHSK
jgi:hypothetical protein